jgi:lipopolysaccharide heptosyltransferase II
VFKLLLQTLGWTLAHLPEWLLHGFSVALGETFYWLAGRRRRLTLSNLAHAFPERTATWRRGIARAGSRQLVETGLLSLAAPYLGETRVRAIARLAPSTETLARELAARPRPVIFATLHLGLWETQTWFKFLSPVPLPEFGIIFRPLENSAANDFVQQTRERFGMRLLSRKEGFAEALKILRDKGCVGILMDQNAGMQGALTTFFGRVCSTTELPGLLASKYGADVRTFYPRRTGFWRVEFETNPVAHDGTPEGITVALNQWLEELLRADDRLCAAWLWAHDRWRHQDVPARRFHLESKRNWLDADLRIRGLTTLPRKTRIFVRLPNWLGDVVMALPLLRALRASRPDAELTLVAKPQFISLLESWHVADRLHALPPRGFGYFAHFRRLRHIYPDTWLLFTNSFRGDLEAWLTGCRQRFGLVRPGKRRPLLSHAYIVPADFDERTHHQLELWENFLRYFGLTVAPDRSPVLPPPLASPKPSEGGSPIALRPSPPASAPIGLICGSENNPAKRWPVSHWRALIEQLPAEYFVLFGTANDAAIAAEVAAGFGDRVENLAGRTTLPDYCARLRTCRLLVTNDTGGMHLANALGVPLIALFGPTNPVRTGPVFSAPVTILQPAGCPPTGGGSLADLPAEKVVADVPIGDERR